MREPSQHLANAEGVLRPLLHHLRRPWVHSRSGTGRRTQERRQRPQRREQRLRRRRRRVFGWRHGRVGQIRPQACRRAICMLLLCSCAFEYNRACDARARRGRNASVHIHKRCQGGAEAHCSCARLWACVSSRSMVVHATPRAAGGPQARTSFVASSTRHCASTTIGSYGYLRIDVLSIWRRIAYPGVCVILCCTCGTPMQGGAAGYVSEGSPLAE